MNLPEHVKQAARDAAYEPEQNDRLQRIDQIVAEDSQGVDLSGGYVSVDRETGRIKESPPDIRQPKDAKKVAEVAKAIVQDPAYLKLEAESANPENLEASLKAMTTLAGYLDKKSAKLGLEKDDLVFVARALAGSKDENWNRRDPVQKTKPKVESRAM